MHAELPALVDDLAADHGLELAHHVRVGRRAHDRADHVVGPVEGVRPVAQRLVDRVLERARARSDRHHLGAEQLHPEHVGALAAHVHLAHVDPALQPQLGGDRGGGHPVLAGAGLGDHARLAHALRQQALADDVVHLVGAGVGQALQLQVDRRAADLRLRVHGRGERRRAPRELAPEAVQLGQEFRVDHRLRERRLQLVERRAQHLGRVAPSEPAEVVIVHLHFRFLMPRLLMPRLLMPRLLMRPFRAARESR